MMSLTIRRRILLSFALVLAVMSGMAALSYAWFTQAEREAIRVETDTVPGLYLSAQLMTTWGEGRGLAREFLLSDTSAEKGDAAAAIAANRDRMHEILKSYDATIMSEEDRRNYAQAVRLFDEFVAAQQPVVAAGRVVGAQGWTPERIAAARTELAQIATRVDAAIATMLELNKTRADQSTRTIVSIVRVAELGLLVSFGLALGLAVLFGYLLFRAVTVPLGKLLGIVEVMRRGDFSERLSLARRDEFSTVANGINAMADDLAGLIGQIQKSGIQVNTSITEVAATSKEQQATASEIAATTTEIGATAKEISATSNELVRTMDEVSEVAEQTAKLAGGVAVKAVRTIGDIDRLASTGGIQVADGADLDSRHMGDARNDIRPHFAAADQTNPDRPAGFGPVRQIPRKPGGGDINGHFSPPSIGCPYRIVLL